MRVKEANRKENKKNQQESEKTPEPNTSAIKELPAQAPFQQSYFVQFLNKKPNKEEAEKIIEIWNKTKPETQRSITKNPLYERLLNIASEISCDAEVEEQEQKPTVNLESEEERELETTTRTKKTKRISTEGEEDEEEEATKSKKPSKDIRLCDMFEEKYHRPWMFKYRKNYLGSRHPPERNKSHSKITMA